MRWGMFTPPASAFQMRMVLAIFHSFGIIPENSKETKYLQKPAGIEFLNSLLSFHKGMCTGSYMF